MDQGDHQTPLLPIDAGIDWQWVEENWDPRAICDREALDGAQASHGRIPKDLFSTNISSDWYPWVDTNPLANNVLGDGFPIGDSLSTSVLWNEQNAGGLIATTEAVSASSLQPQQGMVETASPPRQNGKAKTQRPRIPCSHPDCKATFPRKYELERHRRNIHKRDINVNCSVYGCSRISKPFHRMDKLGEHMKRNHANPSQFLCIFEDCRLGPFSMDELITHINGQHPFGSNTQVEFDQTLKFIDLRAITLEDSTAFFQSISNCPLAFLGCNSKDIAYEKPMPNRILRHHIDSHDLLERSRAYKAIEKVAGFWSVFGAAKCPICQQQVCDSQGYIDEFLGHLDSHSREDRNLHASTLSQMLRPYLTGKESLYFTDRDIINKLKIELKDADIGTDGIKKSLKTTPRSDS